MTTKNLLKKRDKNKIEFKQFKLEIKSTKENKEEGFFEFEGYATVFNIVDHGNDKVLPGAFAQSLSDNGDQVKMLWQHNRHEPIGMFTVKEDNLGLFVKGRLPLDDTFVTGRVIPQLKVGSVDSLSIGYLIVKYSYDEETNVWSLIELELKEISPVTFPMQDEAKITDLKKADMACKWDKKRAEKEISDPGYRIAGNLIADKVKDEPMIIPRAVFAARVAMAKGNPTEEEKQQLNEVYTTLNLDCPFEEGSKVCVDELQNLSKSDRAWAIKNLKLSTNASNFLAGLVPEATEKADPENPNPKEKQVKDDPDNEEEEKKLLELCENMRSLF